MEKVRQNSAKVSNKKRCLPQSSYNASNILLMGKENESSRLPQTSK
jgi:hypothetical protein